MKIAGVRWAGLWMLPLMIVWASVSVSGAEKAPPKESAAPPASEKGVFDNLPDGESKPKKDEAEEEEFGAGRTPAKKETPKKESSKKEMTKKESAKGEEPEAAAEKEKAKYVRSLQKRFNEKKGVYLIRTVEQGYRKPTTPNPNQPNAEYEAYEDVDFKVLDGQEEAVDYVLDFMTEFGTPWEKKAKGSRKKKQMEEEKKPPKPVRDWEILNVFETTAEALNAQGELKQQLEYAKQQAGKSP